MIEPELAEAEEKKKQIRDRAARVMAVSGLDSVDTSEAEALIDRKASEKLSARKAAEGKA